MSSWLSPWLQPQQCPSLLVLPLHRVGDRKHEAARRPGPAFEGATETSDAHSTDIKSSASTAIGKFSAVIGSAMLSQQSRVLSPATTSGPGSDDAIVFAFRIV